MPIQKPWLAFEGFRVRDIPGTIGVYELGDAAGEIIYVGIGGGHSPFGLRGCIENHFSANEANNVIRRRARLFRFEVTTSYLLRRIELLSLYYAETGCLPDANAASPESLPPLARLRPRSSASEQ